MAQPSAVMQDFRTKTESKEKGPDAKDAFDLRRKALNQIMPHDILFNNDGLNSYHLYVRNVCTGPQGYVSGTRVYLVDERVEGNVRMSLDEIAADEKMEHGRTFPIIRVSEY